MKQVRAYVLKIEVHTPLGIDIRSTAFTANNNYHAMVRTTRALTDYWRTGITYNRSQWDRAMSVIESQGFILNAMLTGTVFHTIGGDNVNEDVKVQFSLVVGENEDIGEFNWL